MTPQSQPSEDRASSKVNLLISFIFHAVLVLVLLYFAARSGILGNQLKKISIQMIKEKAPPKPKPPPHVEPPKVETPKIVAAPKPVVASRSPASVAPPTVAPPAAELPSFDFDGGRSVISSTDPVEIYKSAMEQEFRSKWDRPDNMDDSSFVAEVRVAVDRDGNISDPQWEKGSGNTIWDDSVRKAMAAVTSMDTPPPTNFPSQVTIRFDVQEETEDDSTFMQ